jgi:hypothetical protein
MKYMVLVFMLFLPFSASAEWYEDESIDWWIVVYSKMQCAKARDVGSLYRPVSLMRTKQCVYEPENSTDGATLSLGCEKTLNTGFMFATTQDYCEEVLRLLREQLGK